MIITLKSVPGQRVYKLGDAYTDVFITSEGQYQFDVFRSLDSFRDQEPFDGGLCTGNIEDATEMALDQLRKISVSMEAA